MLQASAETIGDAVPPLVEAASQLAELTKELKKPDAGPERDKLLLEVRRLKADLARLASLSTQGLEFCRKWSHVLQSAAGYLPTGEAAPMDRSTSILVRG